MSERDGTDHAIIRRMKHEWDDFFLGARVRVSPRPRSRRFYRTIDYHRPSGWNSPIVKKIIRIYCRVTFEIIKALISIPLAMMVIGSIWMLWTIVMLRFN
jgi:hypothetical protein